MSNLMRKAQACVAFALAVACSCTLAANSPEVDRGLQWLAPRILADGSVSGEQGSIATAYQARTETLIAVASYGAGSAPLASSVGLEPESATEYVARKVVALAAAGGNIAPALVALEALQSADGGFGAAAGYESNALDTALAVAALKAGNSTNAIVIEHAVAALVALQAADGSFGINEQPSIYVTSLGVMALSDYSQSYAVGGPIAAARAYLASLQSGGAYSSTIDNGLATLAFAATSTDSSSFAAAQQALRARQLADGSWDGDVFLTALAVRALAATATGSPPSTTAQVSGRVIEDSGGAIGGARIDVVGTQVASGTSAADGRFALNGLATGSYTVKVSKTGYATLSIAVTLAAGVSTNLGDLRLALGTNSAGLQGTVRHGTTGAPVAGATVALGSGGSTLTDASGSYRLVGALAGAYSVTVSKSGFDSVTSGGTFTSGTIVLFSPSLYPAGTTPNAATVRGRVVSSVGQAPVAGASVRINGAAATTDGTGAFEIAGLVAGATTIEVSASGFVTRTYTVTLASGANDVGALAIAPAGSTVTVSGRVSERGTGLPVAGASVQVVSTTLAASTNVNGNYQLAGVGSTQFTLRVSAAGFVVKTFDVTLSQMVDSTVDVTLDRAASGGLNAIRVSTNRSAYEPFNAIEIEMEVENTTATDQTLDFLAAVFDSQGRVVMRTGAAPHVIVASIRTEVELELHNTTEPAGTYTVLMQGIDATGAVQVEGNTSFVINARASISGGVALDPPIVTASQPVKVKGEVFNHGNEAVPAGEFELTVTLENVDSSYSPVGQLTAGPATVKGAPLNRPVGGVIDPAGVLWMVNALDGNILRVAPDNTVTTFLRLGQLTPPMTDPIDMARDAAGNFYVVNGSGVVLKIAPDTSVTRFATGVPGTTTITVDAAGDGIWLGGTALNGVIQKINPSTGAPTPVVQPGFISPSAIAAAEDGTLFVANPTGTVINQVTAQGVISLFATGLVSPRGVERDAAGNVYVANGDSTVVKLAPDGQSRSVFASGLPDPQALRFDAAGNLFVSSNGNGTQPPSIFRIPAGGGTPQLFARSLAQSPLGAAYDSQGNLFVVSQTGQVRRLAPDGSLADYAPLPASAFAVAIGPGDKPFVAMNGSGNIVRYDSPTSTRTYTGFSGSQGLAWNGGSLFYVAEGSGQRISQFDIDTGVRTVIAESAVSSADDIYVAPNGDRYVLNGSRIEKLVGNTLTHFSPGGFGGQAFLPSPDGGFYIQETFGAKVMGPTGAVLRSASTSFLARGLAVDPSGFILVGDANAKKILRINPATAAVDAAPFADLTGVIPSTSSFAAMTGDGSGGLFAIGSTGQVVRVPSTGGNPSLIASVPSENPQRLAYDPASHTLYIKLSVGIRVVDTTTGATHILVSTGTAAGGMSFYNGLVHVGYAATGEFVSYDAAGVEVDSLAGLNFPNSVTWDGTRIVGTDQSKTFSIVPGQPPKTLARETAAFLTLVNGKFYGTRVGAVVSFDPATRTYATYYDPRVGTNDTIFPKGVAAKTDGTLTYTAVFDNRVVTINAAKQVVASYAGIGKVTGMAIDASGNVFAASDFGQIVRITPNGQQATVLVPFISTTSLAIMGGQLYGNLGSTVVRFDAAGNQTRVGIALGSFATVTGIAATSNALYATDSGEAKVRKLAELQQLVTVASGLSSVTSVRVGADGALYAANRNGAVMRVANGDIHLLGGDMGWINVLALSATGQVFAGNNVGNLTVFDAGTLKRRELTYMPALVSVSSGEITSLASGAAGQVAVSVGFRPGDLYRLSFNEPPAPPPAGTVIGTPQRVTLPAIAVGTTGATANFPDFVPPYPGDYKFSLHAVGTTPGEAVNVLHVGPAATGTMTASASKVPAGSSTVRVSTRVVGADSTSIAKVDGARIQKYPFAGIAGRAMGADSSGTLYIGSGSLWRLTPQGAFSQLWVPTGGSINQIGILPVDNDGNLYAVAGTNNRTIYKLKLNGAATPTVVQTLLVPENVSSIARDSRDQIWVLAGDQINGHVYRATFGAAPSVVLVPDVAIGGYYGLTIDGKDNVYVQSSNNGGAVFKVDAGGRVSTVVTLDAAGEPKFEFEGLAISGDCSDNLIVAPQLWKKFGQGATSALLDIEEHVLVQVTGRTGQVSQVVDGWQVHPELVDFDQMVYDRFSGNLLIRNELFFTTGEQTYYKVPVTCGAINTDLHVVVPPGQGATGFNPAPSQMLAKDDGSQELVWRLQDVDAAGKVISFDTTLDALTYGEKRPMVTEAFLSLQNSFASGEIKVPLTVPVADVDGQADVTVFTDRASYLANENVAGTIMLRNRDTQARALRLTVEVGDAQGVSVAQLGTQVVDVPAGASTTLSAAYNTGTTLVGTYRLQARIADAASGTSLAADTALFDVLSQGTNVIASLSADKVAYDPLGLVTLSARLKNVSVNAIASGLTVTLVLRNAGGTELLRQTKPVAPLTPGAFQDAVFQYRLQQSDIGQYTADITLNDPAIDPRSTAFAVRSSADTGTGLRGAVVATSPVNAGDAVQVRASISNSGNASLSGLPVTIRIVSTATGQSVASWTTNVAVAQNGEVEVSQVWDTTTAAGGTYIAAASASAGGREIALGQANVVLGRLQPFTFNAVANAAPGSAVESESVTISGLLSAAPISIAGGEYRIGNGAYTSAAGTVSAGSVVTVRLTAAATPNTLASATLTVGSYSATFQVTTVAAQDGTPDAFSFNAVSNATPGSVVMSNAVTITGIDIAVPVSIVGGEYSLGGGPWTSPPGTLTSGTSVAIRLTASATFGTTTTATLTVGGVSGAFSVTTTAADSTVDPFAFTAQTNVSVSTPRTSNAVTITGINVPVAISVAGGEYSVNGGAYTTAAGTVSNGNTVTVRVSSSASYSTPVTATLTVAQLSAGFTVTTVASPDPVVTQGLARESRVLALVTCRNAQGVEDFACTAQRRDFLDQYLTALGIEHKLVSDGEVFRSELRCGRWNAYWISGSTSKLSGTLAAEVREAVFRGDALIVDGARDSGSAALDAVLGVGYTASAASTGAVTLASAILPSGTFNTTAGTLQLTLQGGAAEATFASGAPAIVSHAYGSGRTMQFAFDLVATLIAQPGSALLSATVDQALDWTAIAPAAPFTGDEWVPVATTIENPSSSAVVVEVVATKPAAATFNTATPVPLTTTSTQVTWRVTLPPQQSATIAWSVRTPQATGTYTIQLQANRIDGTTSTPIGTTTSLAIDVVALAQRTPQVVSALNALTLTASAEQHARGRAVTAVNDALAKVNLGLYEAAIGKYLSAGDELDAIASVPTAAVQVSIDQLLKEVSRNWCRGGSSCVPGTATGSAFSLLVFGSASLTNGSSTGSVGVGGSASLSSYTVASLLSGDAARMVGGGSMSWTNGSVGQGGSGVIRAGGSAAISANVGRRELTANTPNENWPALQSEQRARSDRYAAMAGTAATVGSGSALNCSGANATWNVCTMTAAQLNAARTINLNYPATSTVLVNVTGGAATLTNGQTRFNGVTLQNSALSKQVIFNMAQMGSLVIDGWGWGGTLLAPRASVTHRNSMIDGQAVFNTLSSTGSFQCSGTFDRVTP